jgi:hypothetical protein
LLPFRSLVWMYGIRSGVYDVSVTVGRYTTRLYLVSCCQVSEKRVSSMPFGKKLPLSVAAVWILTFQRITGDWCYSMVEV